MKQPRIQESEPIGERSGDDRRAYQRFALTGGQLIAEIGAEGQHTTRAKVQDISRGGVKLSLDEHFARATVGHCMVRFLDEKTSIRPAAIRGNILRVGADRGDFFIAVEFAQPLDELSISR